MTHNDRMDQLCAWLESNGIDPKSVPVHSDLVIRTCDDGTRRLEHEAFTRDDEGHVVLNERRDEPAVERRSVPLLTEPPAWWQPFEKPTRDALTHQVSALREQLDDVYRDRDRLLARLAAQTPAVLTLAVDEPGWMILHLTCGDHTHTWRIPAHDLDLFVHVEKVAVEDLRAHGGGQDADLTCERAVGHANLLAAPATDRDRQPASTDCTDAACSACRDRGEPQATAIHDSAQCGVYLFTAGHNGEHKVVPLQAWRPCTATLRHDLTDVTYHCTARAGHYNESVKPKFGKKLVSAGGWHVDGITTWADRADGATPHQEGK